MLAQNIVEPLMSGSIGTEQGMGDADQGICTLRGFPETVDFYELVC
jgi:hypothetical protein